MIVIKGLGGLKRLSEFPRLFAMRLMIVWQNQITLSTRGEILQQRSGRLAKSWQLSKPETINGSGKVEIKLGSSLVYAAIHEYGGVIVPRRAKALRFTVVSAFDGRRTVVFARKVRIPARRYVSRAAQRPVEKAQSIAKALKAELMQGPAS